MACCGASGIDIIGVETSDNSSKGIHITAGTTAVAPRDIRVIGGTSRRNTVAAVYAAMRPAAGLTATLLRKRFDITEDKARESRRKVIAAMEHLQNELGGRDYLVGDAFSVADLTAATMFTPTVLPPERQYPPTVEAVPAVRELTEELESMPGAQWIHEMFRRHRGASAQV